MLSHSRCSIFILFTPSRYAVRFQPTPIMIHIQYTFHVNSMHKSLSSNDTTIFLIISFLLIVFLGLGFTPVSTLQILAPNAEADNPAHERNGAEDAPCKRFALRFHVSSEGKETTGKEWSCCAAGCGEGLSKTIECPEDRVVRC